MSKVSANVGCGGADMKKNALCRFGFGHAGDQSHGAAAFRADQRQDFVNPRDEHGPEIRGARSGCGLSRAQNPHDSY
jgi:hypothetical protein